jgi:hypothetical protein
MRSAGMRALLVLAITLIECRADGATGETPTGNERTEGPTATLFPSVYNVFSLNLISNQMSEAEAVFQANHLDGGLAGDPKRLVSIRRTYHADQYRLLETIPQGSTDDVNLNAYCIAHELSVEDAYLHYRDDSEVYGKDVSGQKRTISIRGWGKGSAVSREQSRVQNFIWTQPRWVLNHRSACVNAYMVDRALGDVRTGVYQGNFIDELGPECGSAGEDFTGLPRTTSGGHLAEYDDLTREALVVACPNRYETDVVDLLNHVQAMVSAKSPGFTIYPNIGNFDNTSTRRICQSGAGCATEGMDYENSSGQGSEEVFYRTAESVAATGRFYVWSEMHGTDVDPTGDLGRDYAGCNYPAKTGARGRHSMWALSNYWIARQGNLTRFAQAPARSPNTWTTPLSAIWYAAIASDLGTPKDKAFSIWQSGIDAAGQKFRIHRRDYANAIVLSRSRNGWDGADWRSFGTPTPLFNLGGTYRLLYSDGTLGVPVTRIGLCLAEAVTLLRDR